MDQLETFGIQGKINEEASVKDKQSIIINSPIEEVWKAITNIEKWSEWNSQIKKVKTNSDEEFEWTYNGTTFKSKITFNDEPYRFCWISKASQLKCIHVYKLDEVKTVHQ